MTKTTKENLRVAIQKAKEEGCSTEEILKVLVSTTSIQVNEETVTERKQISSEEELISIITEVMDEFSFAANIKGYAYIRYAILYSIKRNIKGITKELYPEIAKTFDTTAVRVERAIRHAIENSWKNANPEVLSKYFKKRANLKPTNSEFIAKIADCIKLQYELS